MAKKFLWMDGIVRAEPDPNWNEDEAVKRGLIPARVNKSSLASSVSPRNPNLIHDVMLNSMGSLAWDRSGLEGQ